MLPSCVKTDVWRELACSLSARIGAPVVCGPAVFGKLSFFQELRNRKSDSPFSPAQGIRYVSVAVDGLAVFAGPFKIDESHAFDEELADARQKLPVWKEYYSVFVEECINQASIAGRSEFILKDALQRSKLLLEFSQTVGNSKDAEHALYSALQFLAHKFRLNNISITAFGKFSRYFDLSEPAVAVEQRILAHVKSTKSTCTVQDVKSDFLLEGIAGRESLPKCVLGFPLFENRELVGSVVLYSEHLPSLEGVSEVLYELVSLLSRLLHYERVQESAVTDALTGLSNRAELSKRFDSLLAGLSAKSAPVTVIMIDADNFKNFNDTYGHPEGDRVLRSVADIIRSVVPGEGFCCRYGGEEFIVVLPLAQQDAKDIAELIRSGVEKACPLTVSIGLMTSMNSSCSRETLVREADKALYRAKNLGKNRVIAFLSLDRSLGVIDV